MVEGGWTQPQILPDIYITACIVNSIFRNSFHYHDVHTITNILVKLWGIKKSGDFMSVCFQV